MLKALGAAVAALIVWEIILECCVLRDPGGKNSPVLGRVIRSGTYLQGMEGFCKTRINSLGMRGDEVPSKEPNEYRILSLGDSFTAGFQVCDKNTYTQQLQAILTEKTGKNITVVNAGRDGASPAYYIHLADFYNSRIKPDIAVIQINEQDYTADIFDGKAREFYVKQEDSAFGTATNFRDYYVWRIFPWLKPAKPFLDFSTFKIALEDIRIKMDEYRSGETPANAELPARRDYLEVIDWTIKTLKHSYPDVTILYLTLESSASDVEACLRLSARKYGIDFISTRELFSDYYKSSCQPVNGFNNTVPGKGHLNEIGHTLIAHALADRLLKRVPR